MARTVLNGHPSNCCFQSEAAAPPSRSSPFPRCSSNVCSPSRGRPRRRGRSADRLSRNRDRTTRELLWNLDDISDFYICEAPQSILSRNPVPFGLHVVTSRHHTQTVFCPTNRLVDEMNEMRQNWRKEEAPYLGCSQSTMELLIPLRGNRCLSEAEQIDFIEHMNVPDLPPHML
jgi:hypothetical protein